MGFAKPGQKGGCPECGGDREHLVEHEARAGPGSLKVLALCRLCGAIAVKDGWQCRPLLTHEWLEVVLDPAWYDLVEARAAMMTKRRKPGG